MICSGSSRPFSINGICCPFLPLCLKLPNIVYTVIGYILMLPPAINTLFNISKQEILLKSFCENQKSSQRLIYLWSNMNHFIKFSLSKLLAASIHHCMALSCLNIMLAFLCLPFSPVPTWEKVTLETSGDTMASVDHRLHSPASHDQHSIPGLSDDHCI